MQSVMDVSDPNAGSYAGFGGVEPFDVFSVFGKVCCLVIALLFDLLGFWLCLGCFSGSALTAGRQEK